MGNSEQELPDNEFELEFTDLPPDANPTISGKLFMQSQHHLNRIHNITTFLREQSPLLLTTMRTWLLSEIPKNKITGRTETSEFELEITDLPSPENHSVFATLIASSLHLRPRVRFWRLALAASTLLLVLLLILGNFPGVKNSFSSLLVQPPPAPTPASTNSGSISSWSSIRVIIEGSPGVIIVGNKAAPSQGAGTVIIVGGPEWNTTTTPGPAPQGQDCPGRPGIGFSHEIGSPPVLAAGFTGPYATLHLYPTPVSVAAYPATFGWTASILIEIPTDFTDSITLDDGDQHSGLPILFQVDSSQDPSANLTLDPKDLRTTPSNSSTDQSIAWSVALYFPAAGCYSLDASWPSGHWQVNFSAGR
ncbi:MAG: hypothetical protein NVSMB27_10190 [Ktedonobacteraceae bacterium]